ncbi:MAG: hypothetical protein AAF826_07465 [Pseudomonadota bacterium]
MKRRMFLSGMAAATAAPALPNISLAKAATMFTAAQDHYWVASLVAQTRGAVSASGLAQQLRIPLSMATEVQSLLVQRGIVSAPVAGLTKAVNPLRLPTATPVPSTPKPIRSQKAVQRLISEDITDTEETSSDRDEVNL